MSRSWPTPVACLDQVVTPWQVGRFPRPAGALLAKHRERELDAAYRAYDEHPVEEPDAWGDLAAFRSAAGGSWRHYRLSDEPMPQVCAAHEVAVACTR